MMAIFPRTSNVTGASEVGSDMLATVQKACSASLAEWVHMLQGNHQYNGLRSSPALLVGAAIPSA